MSRQDPTFPFSRVPCNLFVGKFLHDISRNSFFPHSFRFSHSLLWQHLSSSTFPPSASQMWRVVDFLLPSCSKTVLPVPYGASVPLLTMEQDSVPWSVEVRVQVTTSKSASRQLVFELTSTRISRSRSMQPTSHASLTCYCRTASPYRLLLSKMDNPPRSKPGTRAPPHSQNSMIAARRVC